MFGGNIVCLGGNTLPLGSFWWCRYLLYLRLLFYDNIFLVRVSTSIFLVASDHVLQICIWIWHSALKKGRIVALMALLMLRGSAILWGWYDGELLGILLDDVNLRATHIFAMAAIPEQFTIFRNIWLTCLSWRRIRTVDCCIGCKDLVWLQLLKTGFRIVLEACVSWYSVF